MKSFFLSRQRSNVNQKLCRLVVNISTTCQNFRTDLFGMGSPSNSFPLGNPQRFTADTLYSFCGRLDFFCLFRCPFYFRRKYARNIFMADTIYSLFTKPIISSLGCFLVLEKMFNISSTAQSKQENVILIVRWRHSPAARYLGPRSQLLWFSDEHRGSKGYALIINAKLSVQINH